MATRFYLPTTGSAPHTLPAIADGGWEQDNAGTVARTMYTTKQNSALTTFSYVFGATSTGQTRYYAWFSEKLAPQLITGNYDLVVGKCAETSLSGDAHLAVRLRTVTNNGVAKGSLVSVMTSGTEFALIASAATRIRSGAVTSARVNEGDRLVLEIGIHGITPANEIMEMRFGDPTATGDFALTSGLTTDLCPWFELSHNIEWLDGLGMAPWFWA